MTACSFFLFTIILLQSNGWINGLAQSSLNTNTANTNFLLSESGRNPTFETKPAFPTLPQSSTNNQNGNGQPPGRVHKLVDFYNNQVTNSPLKTPSYSLIVSGNKPSTNQVQPVQGVHNNGINTAVPTPLPNQNRGNNPFGQNSHSTDSHINPATPSKPSTKPSFSEMLSGGNRRMPPATHSNPNQNSLGPLPQPPSRPAIKPSYSSVASGGNSNPTSPVGGRPASTPVLPSTIVANNNQRNRPETSNVPTDLELQTLSEDLLRKDTNNAAKLITINYQDKTTSQSKDDKAPLPLLVVTNAAYDLSTIQKFLPLLDNYERDTLVNEHVTPQERKEENDFMDAIMQTQVIRLLMTFLKDKGYVSPDPRQQRDFLKQLWFNLYSRGRGKISSSGFEHVFVSELKNGEVSGLHNWLYFSKEESANRANYLGYLKYEQLGDKGAVMKLHFNQQGTDKPVDSMFIGTSPELEMALYSLCFVTRADQDCPLKLAGKTVKIVTHTFRYRSKNMIGSAYPQI